MTGSQQGRAYHHLNPLPAKPKPENKEQDEKGDAKKTITVKVRKKDWTQVEIPVVRPIPVRRDDPVGLW